MSKVKESKVFGPCGRFDYGSDVAAPIDLQERPQGQWTFDFLTLDIRLLIKYIKLILNLVGPQ